MNERLPTNQFVPSGFFAFRTPLLPFDELLAWSAGLEAPSARHDLARLERAIATDRACLRSRLKDILARPDVREGLFLASPDLEDSLPRWLQAPDSERGQKVERALVRYFVRMAGRATPFGLFAGCSVGSLASETRLQLAGRAGYQRHTRLDMDYLFALAETLGREPAIRDALKYRRNSSLYRAAGRIRYAEARLKGKTRSYHLVAVEDTAYLSATLERARDGASPATLAAALVADDPAISLAEAEAYIQELIASQLLVSDLTLAVTGAEPIHDLLTQLRDQSATAQAANSLEQTQTVLEVIDAEGLGTAPGRYRGVVERLQELPTKVELSRLFQVDMVKPAAAATLGKEPLAEIMRGVDILQRLSRRPRNDALSRFREAFVNRYESREVPLGEALDEEVGIGFGITSQPGAESAPLLEGIAFPGVVEETAVVGDREVVLLRKLSEALTRGAGEIALEPTDLDAMSASDPLPLPDAFDVMASVAAASAAALAHGDFRILLHGAMGPSGARCLGRFCHADPELRRHVEQHLRAEEALEPDALFAEIVHLPQGRVGNVICRPVLRGYEIPYLGRSGAPLKQQIPITDLLVSVVAGQVVLRSARLGRRVIPRLTSAHNHKWRTLGVYKFLGALQSQGVAPGLSWDWGVLENAPFLPRVVAGRLVLARARWLVSKEELSALPKACPAEQFQIVQTWRATRCLPRYVLLADHDNELPIDLDNALSVETFVDLIKGRNQATLLEMFPGPDELRAHGPEGRFVHELVVPFVRSLAPEAAPRGEPHAAATAPATGEAPRAFVPPPRRTFPPGSEWLYAKFYTGTATADRVLTEVVRPVIETAQKSGAADRWFFIRYGDPDWHLRLRLHGVPQRLLAEVLPTLQEALAPLLEDGRVRRVQLDTYEREIERYGGPEGIELAEQVFHADSEAVLEIVEMLDADAGADARWRLTLCGMDMLLSDLELGWHERRAVIRQARAGFAREFHGDTALKRQLGDRFRQERKSLEALLDPPRAAASELAPGVLVLRRRSERLAPLVAALQARQSGVRGQESGVRGQESGVRGQESCLLTPGLADLAPSLLHMHANRLLRSAQRAQEMVLYDFLDRLYESRDARERGAPAAARTAIPA